MSVGSLKGFRKIFHLLCSKGSAIIKKNNPIITIITAVPLAFFTKVENKKIGLPEKIRDT